MPRIPDCTCDAQCLRSKRLPGLDEPQCGVMCLGDGDVESLRPCGTADWYGGNSGAVTFVITPALTGGGWLRCLAVAEHADDLPPGRRYHVRFPTKADALAWIDSFKRP